MSEIQHSPGRRAAAQGRALVRLPRSVTAFYLRALALAVLTGDTWSLRSATRPQDLAALLELAQGRSSVVEVGTGTAWTTAALVTINPLCTVNSFDPSVRPARERYLSALAPAARRRIVLRELPGQQPPGHLQEIDMLFVDGGHDFETTVSVFESWRPRLSPDAVVVFHDYGNPRYPGVAAAVRHLELEGEVQGSLYVWRGSVDEASPRPQGSVGPPLRR